MIWRTEFGAYMLQRGFGEDGALEALAGSALDCFKNLSFSLSLG